MDFHTAITLVVFVLTYIGIAVGHAPGMKLDRTGIVLLGAIALLVCGSVNLTGAIASINWPAILLLFSLMVISSELRLAGFYRRVAHAISRTMDHPAKFLLILMISSGVLSAFLNNDVVCFAFTPIVTVALLKKRLNPVPFLVALALSSNIGCAVTLIGNAQDVVVGQMAHLGFGKYMLWALPPVLAAMAAAYVIVWLLGRKHFALPADQQVTLPKEQASSPDRWQATRGLIVAGGVVVLFFTPLPRYLVALVGAGLLLCSHKIRSKKMLGLVDWQLLILFIGLFVVVRAFHDCGLAQKAVAWIGQRGVNLSQPVTLAVSTGVLSNLINNSAAVMLLVHIVDLNETTGYVLALANTFAGNLLLIGSVANIIVVREADDLGIKISFGTFARYGVPTALVSFGVLLLWIAART